MRGLLTLETLILCKDNLMNIALTEVLKRLHKWEKKDALIHALLLTHSQELTVKVSGRIHRDGEAFKLTYDTGEVRIAFTEDMRFKYGDAILEIIAPLWRCVLHGPRD
jgi:hypothetical protein